MPFTCTVCSKETTKAYGIPGMGIACGDKCGAKLAEKRKAIHAALKAEPLDEMPEALDVPAFERYCLKYAVQFLDMIDDATRRKFHANCPFLLVPEELALDIKERVLRHVPLHYVSSIEARGHERMFYSGTYEFKCGLPRGVLIRAFKKAKLIKETA